MVIDTNTLYYACGLSAPPATVTKAKLLQEIDSADAVTMSSISFAEFLTKYRRHAGIIRRVCSFMRQHHVCVSNNEYMHFDPQEIKALTKIRQREFGNRFERVLVRKVDVESRFASTIFFLVLISTTIFECDIYPYTLSEPTYDFLTTVFKPASAEIFTPLFNYTYNEAYKTDDAENFIRHWFYRYLDAFIPVVIPVCQRVIETINTTPEGGDINIPQIVDEFSQQNWHEMMEKYQRKIRKHGTPTKFVHRSGIKYGKKINDKHISALLSGLKDSIQKVIGDHSLAEYVYDIASNCLSSGGAFFKNDINDALILSALNENDVMLSFDNGVIEHMQKYANDRPEYQKSLKFIKSVQNSKNFSCGK